MSTESLRTDETDTSEVAQTTTADPIGAQERTERRQVSGSHSTSAGDAAKRNTLPGKVWSPSSHRKFLVPPKPRPPPTVTTTKPRDFVQPCTLFTRSHIKVASGSTMSLSGGGGPSQVTLNCASGGTVGVNEAGLKPPIAPPRRKKFAPRSPGTVRIQLPQKPEPPVIKQRTKPAVTPRRKSGVVSESERRVSGEGCEVCDDITAHTPGADLCTNNQGDGDVTKGHSEHKLQRETVPVMPGNSNCTVSKQSCLSDTTVVSTSDSLTIESDISSTTARDAPPSVRPCVPKRRKKRSGIDSPPSTLSPSHKPSLPCVLPKTNEKGLLRNRTKAASPSVDQSATPLAQEGDNSSAGVKTSVRRLTMHFEERRAPPTQEYHSDAGHRRHTMSSKPAKPRKPASIQSKAKPVPRPRPGKYRPPSRKEDTPTASSSDNFESPKRSPFRLQQGLRPNLTTSHFPLGLRPNLASSSPNLTSLGSNLHKHNSCDTSEMRKTRCSPSHVHNLVKELQSTNQPLSGGLSGTIQRANSVSQLLAPPDSPTKSPKVPLRPPMKQKISSSVSDILEVVEELKSVDKTSGRRNRDGDGAANHQEAENFEPRGERLEPEGAESQPTETQIQLQRDSKKHVEPQISAKNRAVSVGDIPLLLGVTHHQVQVGYPGSDVSSYASSEGRGSVMSSDSHSLLDRARQLSRNKKWCDQREVKESGILSTLDKEQLLLQEAIFEVITSEATYHLNLATLIDHFMDDPKMDPNGPDSNRVLDRTQHSIIFSNVKEIRKVSCRFLEEILGLFGEDVLLRGIFPILEDYALNRFVCFERYCASQGHRLKELRECTEKSDNFQRQLKKLEEEANQTLQSLVTAPMQRITKLPLLMSEILKRTPHDDPSREQMELTHRATQQIADLCNKGAGKIGDLMHLENIRKKLNFGQLKPFLIVSPGRQLKKEGVVERLKVNKRRSRVMPDKVQHYLFVFTDLLMITSEDKDRHHVVDYCSLANVTVDQIHTNPANTLESSSSSEDSYIMSGAEWTVAVAGEEHAFLVTVQGSAVTSGKQGSSESSYIFVVKSETEKLMWMEVLRERGKKGETGGPPKTLSGRILKILKKKRQKNPPTKQYWWKQTQVERSGVIKTMTQQELELQEAIFELVTSEEEHLNAMETLIKHYMSDSGLDPSLPEEQRVLSREEYNDIFRNVYNIRDISAGLLKTLVERQKENVLVDSICDILLLCVERKFQGYIRYCTNLPNQMDQLDISLETNESFQGYLKQLEEDQPPLRSLLKAPMDRVHRLPELMRGILRKTPASGLSYSLIESTLRAVEKVEKLCTSGQLKVKKIKELYALENQLDFGHLKPFSLVSISRSLLRRGPLIRLKVTQWFGKTVKKKQNYVIVLNDYLLITKKMENVYSVVDMSPLDRVLVEAVEPHAIDHNTSFTGGEDASATARWAVSKAGENFAFLVTLPDVKRNYTFVTRSEEERSQWMECLTVQNLMSFEEDSYEDSTLKWEYFYLEAVRDYCPAGDQASEDLQLKRGDILRVYRVTNEWCEGLRIRDLHWGRAPTACLTRSVRREGGEGEERGGVCLVEATHDFPGSEAGELQLEKGDVVKIVRQMAGWCEGMKLRGNQWGWFPGTYTRTLDTSRNLYTSSPVLLN